MFFGWIVRDSADGLLLETLNSPLNSPTEPHQEATVPDKPIGTSIPVIYTHSSVGSSRSSSLLTDTPSSDEMDYIEIGIKGLPGAPAQGPLRVVPEADENMMMKDERRYRLWLSHEYHPSRQCFLPSLLLSYF